MLDRTPLSRAGCMRVVGRLWLCNIAALAWICGEYLGAVAPTTMASHAFVQLGRISCAATFSMLPGLLGLALAALTPRKRWLQLPLALLWTVTLLALWVDTRIYGIFRYHFNGLVWSVMTTPGADEAFQLEAGDIAAPVAATAVAVVAQALAFGYFWRREARRDAGARPAPWARTRVVWAVALAPAMLAVAALYARADLVRDPHVMAHARVYPLYPMLTVKRIARDVFGMDLARRPEVDLPAAGISLDYPKRMPVLPAGEPAPNIVVVVVDSLRADMVTPENMPRTSALAGRARVFADHLSSGNGTRFGVFGMLYGLHGSYWNAIYDEKRSPAMIDALLARGYDVCAYTSASWDFPEFRSTTWVRMEKTAEDRLTSRRPGARDDGVAARFERFLGERAPERPFFSYLMLDAPHQRYWFPDEHARFRPYLDEIGYAGITSDPSPEVRMGLFNRYRNSVLYADEVIGRIVDAIAARGELDDTLLVVTADHGEEFFEHGFWGHTSNFTAAQAQVPLLLLGPGVTPGVESRPTCHLDLPSTLLELAGADPAMRVEWTLGASMLDPPAQRVRVVAGWDTLGLHVDEWILEVPMAGHEGLGVVVFDRGWKHVLDDGPALARAGRALGQFAREARRFVR